MINLRYHIVSIVAVFLALGIGVLMGSTVVDRATVDFLRGRLGDLENERDTALRSLGEVQADLRRVRELEEQFAVEGRDGLLRAHLTDVPVLLVGTRGVSRPPVEELVQSLRSAGARLQGSVWFTGKLALASPEDREALAAVLVEFGEVSTGTATTLRVAALTRVAAELGAVAQPASPPGPGGPTVPPPGTGEGSFVAALADAGFVEREGPPDGVPAVPPEQVPLPGTRVVVVSGRDAAVRNDRVAVPFATALATARSDVVVAVESTAPATDADPGAGPFVAALRGADGVKDRLSTVDSVDTFYGRLALVLAMEDLVVGRALGHYGVGQGAQRLLPQAA